MEIKDNPEVVEETTQTPETGEQKQEETKHEEVKDEKTFTQEEFQDALQKELRRKTKSMPSEEDLKAFNKWKESQKTEAEKAAEKEKEYQKIQQENDDIRKENILLKKGVKEEDIDYIIFKVNKQEGDFEDNLEQFLTDNPKFIETHEEEHKRIDLGADHKKETKNEAKTLAEALHQKYKK